MAQKEGRVIFKHGDKKFVRTYQIEAPKKDQTYSKEAPKKNQVNAKGKRKPDSTPKNNAPTKKRITMKHISEQMTALTEIVQQRQNPIGFIVVPANGLNYHNKERDDYNAQDKHFESSKPPKSKTISNIEILEPIVVKQEKFMDTEQLADCVDLTISDSDDETCKPVLIKLMEIQPEKTEIYEDSKEKIKMILKDIPLDIDQPKFQPVLSEERIKLEKKKIYFETHPCTSKEAIKLDQMTKKFDLSNIKKEEKIPGLSISDEYKLLQCNMTTINPHIRKQNFCLKSREAFSKMLTKNALVALYKCMGAKCCYTTMKKQNFIDHLNVHMENPYFEKEFFLNCAYCGFKAKNPNQLVDHVMSYHLYCKYQCNKCLYRSAEARSVFDHQQHHHSTCSSRHILECPALTNDPYPIAKIQERFKQRFKNKLICSVCDADFITRDKLISHLTTYIGGDSVFQTMADEQIRRIEKDILNNRIGKFQCFECEENSKDGFFASDSIKMRAHMQNHPRRFHYVAFRDASSNSIILHQIPTPPKFTETVKFTDNISSLDNDEYKTFIDVE